jgi:excisionase family DNA binding protein
MTPPKLLLTIPEVAAQIGVTRGTVYNLISAGAFPTVDIGLGGRPKTRVAKADLDAWIESRRTVRAEAAS